MPYTLRMPEIAANATHATLVCWNKAEGQRIEAGQSIADIETDKAVLELPVLETSIVGKLLVQKGTEVAVGDPIALMLRDGEADCDLVGIVSEAMATQEPVDAPAMSNPRDDHSNEHSQARRFTSPAARMVAKQNQLDLSEVEGSGPRGRITKHDVISHLQLTAVEPEPIAVDKPPATARAASVTAPSPTRRTIAKRLSQSKSEIPHFYLRMRCNVEALLATRQQLNEHLQNPVSVNDFMVRAAAVALGREPALNVSWREDGLHQFSQVDICVAVDTPKGLMTPIVSDASSKTLTTISSEVRELAKLARRGELKPAQFQGGTFSVSNLGMYGVDNFDAIINPPQAGILAVGQIQNVPVVKDGAIVAGRVMDVVLSVDHRAVDGAAAARWLAIFRGLVEQPVTMLV